VLAVFGEGLAELVKKIMGIIASLGLCSPAMAIGWFSGSGPDYSQGAGNSYYCANAAATPVVTQAGLSVKSPALVLSNPPGSGKNLVVLDLGVDITASPAAAAGFMIAYSTMPTQAITYIASNTVVIPALVFSVVQSTTAQIAMTKALCVGGVGTTLPATPVAFRYLGGTTGASAIGGISLTDETWGKIVVPPGSTISLQATSATSVIADFVWREDPQ
jgi:hypothetical protein